MNRVGTVIYLLFRTAVRGLVSSAMTSVAAIVTIAITLTLLGAFALLVGNMRGMLDRFGGDLRIAAYFETGLALDEARLVAGVQEKVAARYEVPEWIAYGFDGSKAASLRCLGPGLLRGKKHFGQLLHQGEAEQAEARAELSSLQSRPQVVSDNTNAAPAKGVRRGPRPRLPQR